ncbi:MAG: hypothetical protein ACK401_00125 [Archaeoglobaceae archaeon]
MEVKDLVGKVSKLFLILLIVVWGIYHFYPEMFSEALRSPQLSFADKYIQRNCPLCPEPTEWSKCDNFIQFRTVYRCDVTTNYECIPETETKACIPPNETEKYIQREYKWSYKGNEWTWSVVFPKSLYEYYKNKPRLPTRDYSVYVTDPYDDEVMKQLVEVFRNSSKREGFNDWETINFVISFVQSLPYTADNVTTPFDEYPRYPIETLVDNGGDCEDTSILTAELLSKLGYDVVLILLPNHMAVGVTCSNCYGTYYEYKGVKYFYLETTGEGWKIGEIPKEYENVGAIIYPLISKPLITVDWVSKPIAYNAFYVVYETNITVKNEGSKTAKNLRIWVGFDATQEKKVYAQEITNPSDLEPGSILYWNVALSVPRGVYTRLHIVVYGENFITERVSEWFKT